MFGGGGLTNENAYLLGTFARVVLGTSAIDDNGRFCLSSAGAVRSFGLARGLPFPLSDLAETVPRLSSTSSGPGQGRRVPHRRRRPARRLQPRPRLPVHLVRVRDGLVEVALDVEALSA